MQILKHQLLSQKIKLKRQRYLLKPKTYSQKQNTILQKLGLSGYLALNTKKQSVIYLGEIAFTSKAYNDAIYNYKQSALANDKAKYMPTLLLHTAQSFNAIKDTKNYNKFLDSLISNYPTSKEAQNAKKLKEKKDKK